MTQNFIKGLVALGVVVIVAVGVITFWHGTGQQLGGVNAYQAGIWQFGNGIVTGQTGNQVSNVIEGTCNAATTQLPLEATSTDDFTCSVTGALAGDRVSVTLPSNNASTYGGFTIGHAVASTDIITFGIVNLTGAATSTFALATTSVQYRVSR